MKTTLRTILYSTVAAASIMAFQPAFAADSDIKMMTVAQAADGSSPSSTTTTTTTPSATTPTADNGSSNGTTDTTASTTATGTTTTGTAATGSTTTPSTNASMTTTPSTATTGSTNNASTTGTPSATTTTTTTNSSASANANQVEQLLQHISRAQLLLDVGDKANATSHINSAMDIAKSLESQTPTPETSHVHSGFVSYMFHKNKNDYLVPVSDDLEMVKTYTTGPFWSQQKGLAVSDVRAVDVSVKIDPKEAENYLTKAQADVTNNKFSDARAVLNKFQKSIVVEEASLRLPLNETLDNLALARFMMQENFTQGAKYALKHAESSLNKVKPTSDERKSRIAAIRSEIKHMEKTIDQSNSNPTEVSKSEDQVKKWWDEMTAWVDQKTDQVSTK